ncbi:hypothetical protein V8G54_031552 [Vigna mungo]|uniref:Disease resistance protein At4g27190-like leucine-rich repeats domain-containing protein n=1 Tax=Vigna mungo TaxID=3915 RepID=A0AAQ3MK99_VIGMU
MSISIILRYFNVSRYDIGLEYTVKSPKAPTLYELLVETLKTLYMINIIVEKLWHWNYSSKSFCELENLSFTNNNKLLSIISSNMITRFKNLRKLTLNECELLTEVFDFEDDNLDHKIHEILPQLEVASKNERHAREDKRDSWRGREALLGDAPLKLEWKTVEWKAENDKRRTRVVEKCFFSMFVIEERAGTLNIYRVPVR